MANSEQNSRNTDMMENYITHETLHNMIIEAI